MAAHRRPSRRPILLRGLLMLVLLVVAAGAPVVSAGPDVQTAGTAAVAASPIKRTGPTAAPNVAAPRAAAAANLPPKPQRVTRRTRVDIAPKRATTRQLVPAKSVSGASLAAGSVTGLWARPVRGAFIGGWRGAGHYGVDLGGTFGDPIFSVGDGVVVGAGPMGGYGNYVAVLHPGGDASLYAHIQSWSVQVGERVVAGQVIAEVGSTGASSGPHLHFEIHQGGLNWNYIDPEPWLAARGVTLR